MKNKLQSKALCDNCKKKVHFRLKTHKLDGNEYGYLRCSNCKAIYPTYVIDESIRKNTKEIERIQDETFGPESTVSGPDVTKNVQHIVNLKRINSTMMKQLVKVHYNVFKKFGDKVIVKW
jgi:hypothetical protein